MNRLIRTTAVPVAISKRQIDVLAVPFNQQQRISKDLVEAFPDHVIVDPLRDPVPALLHHRDDEPFGHVELHGQAPDGLRATLHAARTDAGDTALELAASGVLYPSIGFTSIKDRKERGVVWRDHIVLWEISLVTFPAYAGAAVEQVRAQQKTSPGKPGLELLAQLQREALRRGKAL